MSRLAPGLARPCRRSRRALDQIRGACRPASLIRPIYSIAEVGYLERAEKLAHKTIIERFVAVVRSKNASPTWSDVRAALLHFDCAGLRGLVQDLYTVSKDNQHSCMPAWAWDTISPNLQASISYWICPDAMKHQSISVSKAKKAIADYKKANVRSSSDLRATQRRMNGCASPLASVFGRGSPIGASPLGSICHRHSSRAVVIEPMTHGFLLCAARSCVSPSA